MYILEEKSGFGGANNFTYIDWLNILEKPALFIIFKFIFWAQYLHRINNI